MPDIGRRVWAIAEGWIPSGGLAGRALMPHETACILNATDHDAHIELTVFFSDREPVRYALEMEKGWFAKRGLAAGSRLSGLPARR